MCLMFSLFSKIIMRQSETELPLNKGLIVEEIKIVTQSQKHKGKWFTAFDFFHLI